MPKAEPASRESGIVVMVRPERSLFSSTKEK